MHQGGGIISPGSLMELLDSSGIANGVIQHILYIVKNILVSFLVYGKVIHQFLDNSGTDGITGRGIERSGGVCKMQ